MKKNFLNYYLGTLFFVLQLMICVDAHSQVQQSTNAQFNYGLIVDAGNDQYIDFRDTNKVTISATVIAKNQKFFINSDTKYKWEKISGPLCAIIGSNNKDVNIKFITKGSYRFRISASNNKLFGSDIVNVYVLNEIPELNTYIDSTSFIRNANYDSSRMLLPGMRVKGKISINNTDSKVLDYPLKVNIRYYCYNKETGIRVENVINGPSSITIPPKQSYSNIYFNVNSVDSRTLILLKAWVNDSINEVNPTNSGFYTVYPNGTGPQTFNTPCVQSITLDGPAIVKPRDEIYFMAKVSCVTPNLTVKLESSHQSIISFPNNGLYTLENTQGNYSIPIFVIVNHGFDVNTNVEIKATILGSNPLITSIHRIIAIK